MSRPLFGRVVSLLLLAAAGAGSAPAAARPERSLRPTGGLTSTALFKARPRGP